MHFALHCTTLHFMAESSDHLNGPMLSHKKQTENINEPVRNTMRYSTLLIAKM